MTSVAGFCRQASVASAAVVLAAIACKAAAVPVCELSVVSQQCVLNIDVGGRGTGPYDLVPFSLGSSISDGSTVTFDFFDELNAAGPVAISAGPTAATSLADWPASGAALWDDGRASLRVTLDSGMVTYNFIEAFYVDATGARYQTAFTSNAVPAPATIPLLAVAALVAFAARHHRAPAPVNRLGGAPGPMHFPL